MTRKLTFVPSARRDFKKLPRAIQTLLAKQIDSLVDNPYPSNVETIARIEHCYRIREDDYRVVYQLRDKELIILVLAIGDRKEIYRHLVTTLKKLISQWEVGQR